MLLQSEITAVESQNVSASERGCSLVKFLAMLDGRAFHELAHTKMPSIAVIASAC